MRTVPVLTLLSLLAVAVPGARAQDIHTAPQSALDAAEQQRAATSATDREAVLRLLERDEVKQVAGKAGLDLRRAQSAVATLEGQGLADVAAQERQVERALAGGQSTITISTTLIIIALLVIILIVVAA